MATTTTQRAEAAVPATETVGKEPSYYALLAIRYILMILFTIIFLGPFALSVGVTAFELLVGFLQAYIFTLLTAVYIADSLHPEH